MQRQPWRDLPAVWPGGLPDPRGRWPWLARPGTGLAVGLLAVALLTLAIAVINARVTPIPGPTLAYALLVLGVALAWGWRAGAATAAAALLCAWYFFVPPERSFSLKVPGEWTQLLLAAVTYGALVATGEAIRRLRRANAGLARIVEQLDGVIGSMADGVIIVDGEGNLLRTNEAMRRIVGKEVPRSLVERNARWQTRWEDGSHIAPGTGTASRALAGEVITGVGMIVRHADGHDVQLSVSGAPLRPGGDAAAGAVLVCRDVTELRRLEQARRDFLAIASHELKTPLTSLSGYLQLLRRYLARGGPPDGRVGHYLGATEAQVRRMIELVETLLDVSRIEAGRLRLRRVAFDLTALVRQVVAEMAALSERHALALAGEPPAIRGSWDRDRIEQVLVNLLGNAIRYSPEGGPITVTVELVAAGEAAASGRAARVAVRDSGIGLTPEQLPLVFERFHQAHDGARHDPLDKGMGLGLYICREIVRQHGGRIWAESPGPGRGATFVLTLPLVAAEAPATATSSAPAASDPAGDGQAG